jgi:hypothetical protein
MYRLHQPVLQPQPFDLPILSKDLLLARLQQQFRPLKAVKRMRNRRDWQSTLNKVQTTLDFVGMVPAFGNAADLINLCISLGRGNYGDAAMNAVSLIPGTQFITAGKLAIRQGRRFRKVGRMKVKREVSDRRFSRGKEPNKTHQQTAPKIVKNNFEGGAYGKMPGKEITGFEKHHTPANAVSPLSKYKGGAVQIEPADHKFTASYGSTKAAKAYRLKQRVLIEKGDFKAAFEMDVRDLQSKFGDKYDEALKKAKNYYIKEGLFK